MAAESKIMIASNVIDSDVLEMLQIERDSFPYPWTEDDFYYWIVRDAIVVTARSGGIMQGYAIAMPSRKHPRRVRIVNLAVAKRFRNRGIAKGFVEMIDRTMKVGQELVAYVHEWNDTAIRFFAHIGFLGVNVKPRFYQLDDGTWDDAWVLKRPVMREVKDSDCTGKFLFEDDKR